MPTYLERIDDSNSLDGTEFEYIFTTADNTFDEAKWAFKVLGRREKVIFMTTNYHVPRTRLILKFALESGTYHVVGSQFTGSPYKQFLLRINEFYKRAVMKLSYILY